MSVDKSPVYEVKAVPVEKVLANDYNPNVGRRFYNALCMLLQ